jgi:hypothetical protein
MLGAYAPPAGAGLRSFWRAVRQRIFGSHHVPPSLASTAAANASFASAEAASQPIAFVQANYSVPQTAQTTVSVPFIAAQNPGDLIVVVAGWSDGGGTLTSLADTSGNNYAVGAGLIAQSGGKDQVIAYAPNIAAAAAGANVVTVTFSAAVVYPDVRILEYSGVNPSAPLDGTASAQGDSGESSSGSLATTNASDLIVAANTVRTSTHAAGAPFTQRIMTRPDGDIVEDEIAATPGSGYQATAQLITSGDWVMQAVAFAPATGVAAPISVAVNPSSATVNVGGTQSFTAIVSNDSANAGVTWTLSGGGCSGAACGSLSAVTSTSVTYTAPASAPNPANVTLTATSVSDVTKSAAATIAIGTPPPISVSIAPQSATVNVNASQAFTAAVSNDPAGEGVTWALSGNGCSGSACGTLSNLTSTSATYTAPSTAPSPATATLTATSVSNSAISAAAAITIAAPPAGAISYVQENAAVPVTPQSSVSVAYARAQTAGDMNVVAIGWFHTVTTVTSITDSSGNAYAMASGPTTETGAGTAIVAYAKNISAAAAGANSVTVTFSEAAPYPDVRILEYSGLDPASPLDVSAAGTGIGTSAASGLATISYANELIFGASFVATGTAAAGTGFTSRVITVPNGDIAEDEIVSAQGSYSATAPLTQSGAWIMQLAAFRAAGSGPPAVSIGIAPLSASVAAGGTQQFTATVLNSSNTGVVWTLSGAGCTGSACGNLSSTTANTVTYTAPATIPNPPSVTLAAVSDANSVISASATIGLTAAHTLVSIAVSPANATIAPASTQSFTATGTYADSTTADVTTSAAWSSSNSAVAIVAAGGTATGVATGSATISATLNSISGSAALSVSTSGLPAGVGWHVLPAATALSASGACPPNYYDGDPFIFATDCKNVIRAWSGAIADTNANRLLIWGGGHLNYYGNEIYSLNLTQNPVTLTRVKDPTIPTNYDNQANCVEGIPAGDPTQAPNSRESYGGLAYIANADAMFTFGGSLACANGWGSWDTWTIPLATLSDSTSWQFSQGNINGTPPSIADGGAPYGAIVDYDPNSGLVFVDDGGALYTYNYSTNSYNQITPDYGFQHSIYLMGAIDPVHKLFVALGNCPASSCGTGDGVFVADISNPASTTLQDWTAATLADSNCAAFIGGGTSGIDSDAAYPGLTFDTVAQDFVGWPSGGNSVYILTPDTVNQRFTCQVVTYDGGPPNSAASSDQPNTTHGTYGRFRYFPGLDVFVLINDWDIPAYFLRLR